MWHALRIQFKSNIDGDNQQQQKKNIKPTDTDDADKSSFNGKAYKNRFYTCII